MRSKLLRAMRHVKAAALHILKAKEVLEEGYMYRERNVGDESTKKINEFADTLAAKYAKVIYNSLAPAEKP